MQRINAIYHVRKQLEFVYVMPPPAKMLYAAVFALPIAYGKILALDTQAVLAVNDTIIDHVLKWIMKDPQVRVPLVVALIGLCGIIIGSFLTVVIWPFFKSGLAQIWDKTVALICGKEFENLYLDWIVNEHRHLPSLPTTLAAVTEKKGYELDKLYVSLTVAEDTQRTKEVSLHDALHKHSFLVILGDPGAGKTTILRFLALTFARARRRRPSSAQSAEREEKAKVREACIRVNKDFGYKNFPLPIFVYLSRLRNVTEWNSSYSLLDALRDEWKSVYTLRNFPADFFDKKLKRGECIFLFDAFDEVGTQAARDAIADRIGQFAASAPPGNRFIVTSRIRGYSGQLSRYGFDMLTVQILSRELIGQLVRKWYAVLSENMLADQLLNTLEENPRICELATNPMLLSLIVLVQYIRRLIPDRRHILYDECVKILVERRYAPVYVQEEYNKTLPSDEAVRLLREIAIDMHRKILREVPRNHLEQSLIPRILKKMPNSKAATVSPIDLIKNIEQRSQILVERGFNEMGLPVMAFSHMTFQEYLTSLALKESTGLHGEAAVSDDLIRNYETIPEWWEEVALLYAAQLDGPQQQSFIHRLHPEQNGQK